MRHVGYRAGDRPSSRQRQIFDLISMLVRLRRAGGEEQEVDRLPEAHRRIELEDAREVSPAAEVVRQGRGHRVAVLWVERGVLFPPPALEVGGRGSRREGTRGPDGT